MSRTLRSLAVLLALLAAVPTVHAEPAAPLERGVAIIDPAALAELDRGRFGLGHMLAPERSADVALTSDVLFALSSMAQVGAALAAESGRYVAWHRASLPDEAIGVGEGFAFQLFDSTLLSSSATRLVLSGIVNRMDRAYVSAASCGEIRLIYRLVRTDIPREGEDAVAARLPMTFNLVMKARDGATGEGMTCADIARRWLATGDPSLTGTALARRLLAKEGPLALVSHDSIDRIETNLQIAHAPKSAIRDFRTDYLLKVFTYDRQAQRFEEAPLENQIDRDRLLADENLAREFKAWLLDPVHFAEFDRGTLLIPDKFLARSAIAPTPAGFDVSPLQPEFGLLQGEGNTRAVFSENDVVAALKRAADDGTRLQNIRSVAGFERRLNDITCSGCHQTRGIGGFHFPGVDWMAAKPSNSTVVPASPHFFGDQVRRRDILASFARGNEPDFSRGFSSRPQPRGSTELAGTGYDDGWGAHCYRRSAKPADNDKSFQSWSCAEGLSCQVVGKTSRMGMCFVKER